jgi:alkaline phosphatase
MTALLVALSLVAVPPVLDVRAVPKPGEHVLVGAGDIADCSGVADATARIVEQVLLGSAQALAFTAGDNAYQRGSLDEFRRCYAPTWGRFLDRTAPVAGNHEYLTPGAAGHFAFFGKRAGDPRAPWRSITKGSWKILLLDSDCKDVGGCGPGSPQATWLKAELTTTPAKCTVAIWHHPRFSSGRHGDNDRVEHLFAVLDDARAEIVIAGHDHSYERFVPLRADGSRPPASEGGLVSFVVGTGGRKEYPLPRDAAGSAMRFTGIPGVLVLFLDDDGYHAFFVDTAGKVRDEAAGRCR